ncbi:hypothetical protein PV325_007067, partial [Microctonus aethiopoides]
MNKLRCDGKEERPTRGHHNSYKNKIEDEDNPFSFKFLGHDMANGGCIYVLARRGEIIELKLKRTEQYLASKNLPVWSAWKNEDPQLIPDVMNEVGDFIMYHDIEHSAAVVYFAKSDAIFGVIDTRFYINGLPLSELGPNIHHEVGGDYVKDRNVNDNSETFHDFATQLSHRRSDEEMNEMHSPPIRRHDCNPSSEPLDLSVPRFSESTDPQFKILYPEILVF